MTDGKRETILVVDDQPLNVDLIVAILSSEYEVRSTSSGTEALAIAQSEPQPSLILLDVMMPGMDGYEVCRRLKADARTQDIPIIFLTARIAPDDEEHGLRLGAVDYLHKPCRPAIVLQRVHNHLGLRNQNLALEHKIGERTRELERLGRAHRLLSECSMALVRADEEQALLDAICRLVVDIGGYRMAWIGVPEHDPDRSVRVVGRHGDDAGYLDAVRVCWCDGERGRGPTGAAIRTGATQVNPDFLLNPLSAPWRDEALRRGFRSSIALPLANLGVVFGALTLYADEAHAFGTDEVALLEELAGNVTFGIESLRSRNAHLEAENELRLAGQRLQQLTSHLATVREEERTAIARELHDELGQMLTALKMDISLLRSELSPSERTSRKLDGMTALVDDTLVEVRRLASDLRPVMLDDLGLKAAVEWLVEEFGKRYAGIACNLVVALDGHGIEGELATAAYRIVQECLTNVVRHAHASKTHIVVGVRDPQQLFISVQDNGSGLPAEATEKAGFGLLGMRERVSALGGTFVLDSIPGEGVSVDVTLPLRQAEERRSILR